jgi:uncharacterized protein YebE (UPF0316 family)
MDYQLLLVFVILNVANVIIQTVKSIATIKCGKWGAALTNAIAYGLYTVVIVYTVCDLPLYLKAVVVALANLIGVYVVKLFEEKARKDKLWKIEVAIPNEYNHFMLHELKKFNIPHNYVQVGDWTMFNCYCATQQDTQIVKNSAKDNHGKISAYESKAL